MASRPGTVLFFGEIMSYSIVYMTAGDISEARRIGSSLVKEKLAACANCIDKMQSTYWWKGAIEESSEAVLIAKTRTSQVQKLTARVKELHSYDVPCVVSWEIGQGSAEYLDWIGENTHDG